jgi:hypothetical protein
MPSRRLESRMRAAALSAELTSALHELAWSQWAQLGLSGAGPLVEEGRAADPEALLLFTLEIGRTDPRLFDEVLDWLALNEALMSAHRLRSLCVGPTDRALADAALEWTAKTRRPKSKIAARPTLAAASPVPLFPDHLRLAPFDEAFARHGFLRPPAKPSRKSQAPRLRAPISFAFRLRRLLGVGVRAEAVRALLTIRAPRLAGAVVAASAGFDQRNVREGLSQLHEAGVVTLTTLADERYYSIDHSTWAALLALDGGAPSLPFHYDWIQTYRALTKIVRWLQQPGLDELSPFVRASQARTLAEEIAPDLRYAGVPTEIYAARGADFWGDFVEMTRAAIRSARGPEAPCAVEADH